MHKRVCAHVGLFSSSPAVYLAGYGLAELTTICTAQRLTELEIILQVSAGLRRRLAAMAKRKDEQLAVRQ